MGTSNACPVCGKPVRNARGCGCRRASFLPAGKVETPRGSAVPETRWHILAFEASLERWFRLLAFPLALLVFWALVHTGFARMLVRTTLSMWTHEIGHAVAAWLCGRFAFPGPWFTPMAERRSWIVALIVAVLLGWTAFRLGRSRNGWILGAILLLFVQVVCTFFLSEHRVRTLIIWAGDGGSMLLGTLMMLSFYAGKHTQLRVGWLRWGFLAIGAAALTDTLATWWQARHNSEAIPFGEYESGVLSDPTVLVFQQGISLRGLVNSYLITACLCFAVLLFAYVWGLRRNTEA